MKVVVAVILVVAVTAGTFIGLRDYGRDDQGAADEAAPAARDTPTASATRAPVAAKPLEVSREADGPLRLFVAGDSISASLFADREADGFLPLVVRGMEQSGPVEVLTGQRVGADLATVSGLVGVESNLDLGIVELGTNDIGQKTPVDEFTASYRALLAKLTQKNANLPIVCVGVWFEDATNPLIEDYDGVIEQECSAVDGRFVSLRDIARDEKNHGPAGRSTFYGTSDTFHPNNDGHRKIAAVVSAAFEVAA